MKTILCYGDSLTWGLNPQTGTRYEYQHRWTSILQNELGNSVRIIEEALPGRTFFSESIFLQNRSGASMLAPLLESHAPIDLVILLLGTNDVSPSYKLTASEIALGCLNLIWTIQKSHAASEQIHPHTGKTPEVLLIAPPPLGEVLGVTAFHLKGGEETSRALAEAYKAIAETTGAYFLDAAQYIQASKIDGVHWEVDANKTIAKEINKAVSAILFQQSL